MKVKNVHEFLKKRKNKNRKTTNNKKTEGRKTNRKRLRSFPILPKMAQKMHDGPAPLRVH